MTLPMIEIVIAFTDGGNSYNKAAVVNQVSGTSISFGTPVIFNSGGYSNYFSAVFDS